MTADIPKPRPDTADLSEIANDLHLHKSDRELCILAVSLLDSALTLALKAQFVVMTPKQEKELFRSISNFNTKIRLASALGILLGPALADIDVIREIRNDFAHDLMIHALDHPAVAPQCMALVVPKMTLVASQGQKLGLTMEDLAADEPRYLHRKNGTTISLAEDYMINVDPEWRCAAWIPRPKAEMTDPRTTFIEAVHVLFFLLMVKAGPLFSRSPPS
ncbi:hypothetical protein [Caulobacter segnis]|uniref:hypothetical protein n=1 Tax=Caulobacter segnis TaxID=88688 RepID=UPI0028558C6E|nr:hypothetical protein [Caulobacter segnis]MDR6626273.1 hypothetical protein [Caulobacter segnis]